jgi:uncharacterized sporulation protein YeaH/YhbH (DUF444 family)
VEIETEELVFQDVAENGLPQNYDLRRTVMENMKKNALKGKMRIGGFENGDIRYRVWENVIEKHSNAAVFLLMDRSGSMTSERKYIVKSFFWWMVRFIEKKYKHVDLIFIAHDTQAREVEEENFFKISEGGGTMVSSAFVLANEIIESRYPSNLWNNYVFSFSDGDNWGSDNEKCIKTVKELLPKCQAIGYGEIECGDYFFGWSSSSSYKMSTLAKHFGKDAELVDNERFLLATIEKKEDIYKCLKEFLKGIDDGK